MMKGLVSYASDEEEEEVVEAQVERQSIALPADAVETLKKSPSNNVQPVNAQNADLKDVSPIAIPSSGTSGLGQTILAHSPSIPLAAVSMPSIAEPSNESRDEPPVGPSFGPAVGPTLPSPANSPYPSYDSPSASAPSAPLSPYSLTRSQIHSLTLPHTIPPIPPSPPGTPPPETSNKFSNFLTLKRQGIHFNEKLGKSSALRNPRLLEKLMGFVGLDVSIGFEDVGGTWSPDQYVSHLPKSVWDPAAWASHEEGFIERLRKTQQEVLEKRQKQAELDAARGQPRSALAFVGEKGTDYGSRKEGGPGTGAGRSAAERVMAGLDRSERPTQARSGDANSRRGRDGYDRDKDRDRDRDRRDDRRDRDRDRDRDGGGRGGGGGSDDFYRNRDRKRERDRDRERDRRKYYRSHSRSRSRDKDRNRDGYRR